MAQIMTALRYPGGKSKALTKILPVFKNDFIEYREPFVGGGSIFIAVKQCINPHAIYKINDLNKELYVFWKYVKEEPDLLINEIIKTKLLFPNGKKLFDYYIRTDINWDQIELAVRFFILNRITFSGNVGSGGYSQESFDKRFTESSIRRIKQLSPLLANVKIYNDDYTNLLFERGSDVFIYLDPPYSNNSDSKFYGNNGILHTTFDHKRFANNMKKCKHSWLITYDDSPEIRESFSFAKIYPWELQYSANSNSNLKTKKGKELFISNYEIKSLKEINN